MELWLMIATPPPRHYIIISNFISYCCLRLTEVLKTNYISSDYLGFIKVIITNILVIIILDSLV